MQNKWECYKCGSCCHVGGIGIPEFNRGDGVCIHLTDNNLCDIYDKRPNICIVKEYDKLNNSDKLIDACNKLRRRFLNDSFTF